MMPPKALTIEVLGKVAAKLADESAAQHPIDISLEMMSAIEGAAVALQALMDAGTWGP